MISKHCKCFCKELEKIENYDKATADTTQIWDCHHRLEFMPFSGRYVSSTYLMKQGMYCNVQPEALIFLPKSEHSSLHNVSACKHYDSKERNNKISNSRKGQASYVRTEEHRELMSRIKTGWHPSEESRKKNSQNHLGIVRPQTEEEHQKRKATFAKIKEAYANRQDKSITWNEFQKTYKENK